MDRFDESVSPETAGVILPPAHPPPLLSVEDLLLLARQGHLPLQLSPHLQQLFDQLLDAARTFFALPKAQKTSKYPSPRSEIGYFEVPSEKEYLSLRSSTETGDPAIEKIVKEIWKHAGALLHRVLGDIAAALNADPSAWDPVLDGCLTMPASKDAGVLENELPSIMRIFRYEPHTGVADPHTDTGLLTLCIGAGEGLQLFSDNGLPEEKSGPRPPDQDNPADAFKPRSKNTSWSNANGPTLLIGQTLRTLCSGRVRSGLHRVTSNPDGRMSIIFALRPCLRNSIDLSTLGGDPRIVNMRELYGSILGSKYNVNAKKDTREHQQRNLKMMGASGRAPLHFQRKP